MCCYDRVFKKSFTMKSGIGIMIGLGLSAVVWRLRQSGTLDAVPPATVTTNADGEEVQAQVEGGRAKLIAFDKNSTIKDALRILAALYEKNIVPSGKIDGILGFTKLRDVSFEEAMEAVLGSTLVYRQEGQLIKIYGREEYKKAEEEMQKAQEEAEQKRKKELEDPARMICKVFTLYYVSAAEASPLVQSVLSSNGTVKASTKSQTALPTGQSISGGSGGEIAWPSTIPWSSRTIRRTCLWWRPCSRTWTCVPSRSW